jgi:E3 ubiquitin-protein ligase synoviolin
VLFLHETIATTLAQKGHSVQLLFAFEYIILASASVATLLKYILSMVDSAMEGRWDGKGTYVFYLELLTDMLHLFVYCIFFVIVFTNYGLPLHLVSFKPVGLMVKHSDLCWQCTHMGCLQRQPKGPLHV